MRILTRRSFVALTAGSLAAPAVLCASVAPGPLTAAEVLRRMQDRLGGEWPPDGTDGLKAGDATTPVTGIVTTAMASLAVLQAAAEAGANLVITSEPVFFSKADTPFPQARRTGGASPNPSPAPPDPVFTAKADFLKKHRMVVIRLNEHWRMQKPNPFAVGFATSMGWMVPADRIDPAQFSILPVTLATLASQVKARLGNRGGLRVVGDRALQVRSVAFLPGSTPLQAALDMLPHVDILIAGEVREWETTEYLRDTVALGGRKALVSVGRIVSEEPGMRQCAEWLKTVAPEVPCTFRSAGDPYWRPQA